VAIGRGCQSHPHGTACALVVPAHHRVQRPREFPRSPAMRVRTARWWIRTRSWVPALLRLVGRRCAGLVPQAGLARRWWMRFSQGVFLRAGSARIRRLLLGTRLLRKLPRGPESSASLLRCYYCAPHFLLGTQRFPARFRRGSAPGSGDWPGLQIYFGGHERRGASLGYVSRTPNSQWIFHRM